MINRNKSFAISLMLFTSLLFFSSCNKLLEIPPPIDSITTEELFANNKQAEWALAGMYSKMINGLELGDAINIANKYFSGGLSTLQGALSADELMTNFPDLSNADYFSQNNKLTQENSGKPNELWFSAFKTIADANAIIDGVALSSAELFTDSARKQVTGEALAMRAFCYFYLVNFYGDVPLPLTADIKKITGLSRSPVSKVYDQIKADLIKAKPLLVDDFSVGNNERVRISRWFAEALLARVYLYTGEYQAAINSATAVISQSSLFTLDQNISNVFLPNNMEAIFQLKPSITGTNLKNGTPEGYLLNTSLLRPGVPNRYYYPISEQLLNAFEPGDKRLTLWTKAEGTVRLAAKYTNGDRKEYYTVMRLAELYLIRAEATMLLTPSAKNAAIDDLNLLRRRADVNELDYQLTAAEVMEAIAHERRIELFVEWGHRWLDLKRTGKAHEVLSIIPYKQPWLGDYQLLYPVPKSEIAVNGLLTQNPEYTSR